MVVTADIRQKDRWDFRFPDRSRHGIGYGVLSSEPDIFDRLIADTCQAAKLNAGFFGNKAAHEERLVRDIVKRYRAQKPKPLLNNLKDRAVWEQSQYETFQAVGAHYDKLAADVVDKNKPMSDALTARADDFHYDSMCHEINATICSHGLSSIIRRPGMSPERAERLVDHIGSRDILEAWYSKDMEEKGVSKTELLNNWERLQDSPQAYAEQLYKIRVLAVDSLDDEKCAGRRAALRKHVGELYQKDPALMLTRSAQEFDEHCGEFGLYVSHPVRQALTSAYEHQPSAIIKDNEPERD